MISRLSGKLVDLDLKAAVIDIGGIGYKVFISGETIEYLAGNLEKPVNLFTYLAVRENALDLYGFKNPKTLYMFELLITVSGIGPKSALSILNVASEHTLREAITSEDTTYLTKVSGIGKKNAEKIVLELKGKIKEEDSINLEKKDVTKEAMAIDALKSLGFEEKTARESIKKMGKDVTVEEMIRGALRDHGEHHK